MIGQVSCRIPGRVYAGVSLAVLLVLCLAPCALSAQAKTLTYTVAAELPHDPEAFTQGLFLDGGFLYESTGLNGRSSLRRVDPATGRILARTELAPEHFGEGLARWGDRLIQLTWRSRLALVYDRASLKLLATLPLDGEGWGLAATPLGLVSSDGSATLTWRDPATMRPLSTLAVTDQGRPVARLNELEWAEGRILANVWHDDRIAVIVPGTGRVEAWIDCSGLRQRLGVRGEGTDLNGLAWDPSAGLLYVTGKLWPKLFVLRVEGLGKP